MKLVEIKGNKSGRTLAAHAKKCHIDLQVKSFQVCNSKKHIFKKKTRLTRKQKSMNNAKPQHECTTNSNEDEKTQLLPNLQLKQFQTKISSSNASSSCKMHPEEQQEMQPPNIQLKMQAKPNRDEASDVCTYIQSIGEHLLKQQSLFPMPSFQYTASFSHYDRMHYLQLMLDFSLRYKFKVQTIFLAFNIYHRIAFAPQFHKCRNALKAVSSLFVAAKYQEIAIPKAQVFSRMDKSQNTGPHEILRLQSEILLHFNFNLGFPTVLHFIDILRIHHNFDCTLRQKLIKMCYSSLHSSALWQNAGSLLALACLHMAQPSVYLGSDSEDFNKQLRWRVEELRRLGVRQEN